MAPSASTGSLDELLELADVDGDGELEEQRLLRREVAVGGGARHEGGLGRLRHRRGDPLPQQLLAGLHQRLAGAALLVDPTELLRFPLTRYWHTVMVLKYHEGTKHPGGRP